MRGRRIAILGAGIMGASTALFLARRGASVDLIDAAGSPFTGASRWNEGKIHLGYLYSADPTLRTAEQVISGGLLFRPLLEELLGCALDMATTQGDDYFFCHRDSVVDPESMGNYFLRVFEKVGQHPDVGHYLAPLSDSRVERLSKSTLRSHTDSPEVVAGFRIPERSVLTAWVADRFLDALAAESGIALHMNTRIVAARPSADGSPVDPWMVHTLDGPLGPYDVVINCLWQGRLAVDVSAGLPLPAEWSHRYRLALFLRTSREIDLPCSLIATGPFGDIKNYNQRDFYLSWYPAGLRLDSSDIQPLPPPPLDDAEGSRLEKEIVDRLQDYLPSIASLRENIEEQSLRGGWVYAVGRGMLADPASRLHRRSSFGIVAHGRYLSVDTGKYSTAPWLARRVVEYLTA